MPIYEFECTKCGHSQEALMKFSDKPLTHCESCNGKMKKLISPSTFHLKGTGWYVTDYASKSKKNTQEKTKSTEKTESKSEAKTSEKSSDSKKTTSTPKKSND